MPWILPLGVQGGGIEVGMGVKPHDKQRLALRAAMARNRADRADGQAVVAT